MNGWSCLFKIIKVNQRKNSLVVKPATRLFFDKQGYSKLIGCCLFLVPPELDIPRQYKISDILVSQNNAFELFASECENIKDLSLLKNKCFLINNNDLVDIYGEHAQISNVSLTNFNVIDTKLGEIGIVKSINEMPGHDILIVDSDSKEIMIPFVEDIVTNIENNSIYVSLPDGLVDLN